MSNIEIKPVANSTKSRRRVGRGTGSGKGKTCGRGNKGQKSRSGGTLMPWFEGGQMPLYRRIPKKGFKNINKVFFNIINIANLNIFKEGDTVDIKSLKDKGLIKKDSAPVKLLANGDLSVTGLKIEVNKCSDAAKQKVESAGGSVKLA
jgi:large subunit ribosomal protein L15